MLVVKNTPANARDIETRVQSVGREDPLEDGIATTPVFLPEDPMDRGAWQALVQSHSDMTEAS